MCGCCYYLFYLLLIYSVLSFSLGWKAWQRLAGKLCKDKHVVKVISGRQWLLCKSGMLTCSSSFIDLCDGIGVVFMKTVNTLDLQIIDVGLTVTQTWHIHLSFRSSVWGVKMCLVLGVYVFLFMICLYWMRLYARWLRRESTQILPPLTQTALGVVLFLKFDVRSSFRI